MEKYFDKWAETYSLPEDLPFFLKWNFSNLLSHIPKKGIFKILDIGTGNGMLITVMAKHNSECEFTGLDLSAEMLKKAENILKEKGINVRLIKSGAEKMPLDDNSFDFVVSNNALHHVKDKQKLYSEIMRVLKPEGKIVYSDNHDAPDEEFDRARQDMEKEDPGFCRKYKESADNTWQSLPEHIRKNHPESFHYPFSKVREFLKSAGFRNIMITPSPSYFAIVYAEK